MASPLEQRQSRSAAKRRLSSSATAVGTRLEPIRTSKRLGAAQVTTWPSPSKSVRRPRSRRNSKSACAISLRWLVPAWLVRAVIMLAAIGASWLALIWVMVTQDPAQSTSRVIFVISVFAATFVTSLPIMHRVFSQFAPSRLQQGNPVLVAGHSFLLSSILVANLSLVLVGGWNLTMFLLIAALAAVVESLFLARK